VTDSTRPPGISIRDLRPEDYDAVVALWADAGLSFRPQGRDARERVTAELKGDRSVFLAAELEGQIVGVVLGTQDGRKGWINRLAVTPELRRRGIARMLVHEVETRLEALGLDIIAALIETPNQDSLCFFRSIGYVHDPEIEYVSRRRSAHT
jgi:ribosomal protein S18 acetylase RimI-like enzyme